MLTLASHLSQNHRVDVFWDDADVKAPLSRFLKIDLSKVAFVDNIFKYPLIKRFKKSIAYSCIFVISDGSVPAVLAPKSILHFQVPFKFQKQDAKTKLKLRFFRHVVCNSKFTKEFIDQSFGIDSQVIYPPVDVKSIVGGKKENLIISVGRFSKHQLHPKKQEVLIEVFKEIYKKEPSWRLILAGQAKKEDEKYLRTLKKSARGVGIKIYQNMQVDKLRDAYSKAAIYWHATGFGQQERENPQAMEHFGIATVEAQAAGAVPVVIGKGGQKEIVIDGKNGILWTTKAQLFEATLNLIKDSAKRKILSKEAVKNSRRFSQETFIRQYEKILL